MRLSAFFPALSLATAAVVPSTLAVTFSDLCGKPWRKTVPALPLGGNMTVFNFSRVAMPRGSRLIVRHPSENASRPQFGAIEPDTDECSWAFFSRWDSITLDYVPPEVACSNASAFGVTIDVMDTATYYRNDTRFFSEGCGSFTANATASAKWDDDACAKWDDATCAKGKPGWQESPLDKEVDGCKRELVTQVFSDSLAEHLRRRETASAWNVVFDELEIVRGGRLVVEALREAPGDWTNSSAPPVHTVVPMEKCTWRFVVNAPGFRAFYEPPARCTKAARGVIVCGTPAITEERHRARDEGSVQQFDTAYDWRAGRGEGQSIILARPRCEQGAADGKLTGMDFRVRTPIVLVVNLTWSPRKAGVVRADQGHHTE
ncbi:hypothetical protein P43SY_009886 [Pythium insidiosum]|uniref:Uncharacterized protein n=1 Tax=Pythium insidiosum TaxID=114742 RepID=A0AAD5Q3A4_PYTIN|nr:hypothetical protein P43SY_009886 [Pythium insidiosum]